MSELTVALLQIEAAGYDQDENLRRGEAACRRAAALGADIALFPEMWNIGYAFEGTGTAGDLERWRSQAIEPAGPFVTSFRGLAAELGMAIAVTYLEAWRDATANDARHRDEGGPPVGPPAGPRNTVTLIDRHGHPILTYAKAHTCAFEEPEASCTPGDDFPVAALDTVHGPVQVGAMICFDREFPETARILSLNGAELILVPNACPMEDNRTAQLRARAFENMVAAALANYPASHPDCDGHSVAFHPCAHSQQAASRDTLIVRADGREQILLARFDLGEIRAWRENEVWGVKYRRPAVYGRLVEE